MVLLAIIGLLSGIRTSGAQIPPNVVFIIGDDLGWPDVGFMQSPRTLQTNQGPMPIQDIVQTPNLNALAASGVLFRNGYTTASVCLPSLRTLLSAGGLHSFQWDSMGRALRAVPALAFLPPRGESQYLRTLPRELGRLGYKSWEGGKMWEGSYEMAGFTNGLATALVSDFFTSIGDDFGRRDWDLSACGSTGAPGVPCPALAPFRDFLDSVTGQPFFAWLAPMLPHPPFDAPQVYRQPYEDLGLRTYEVDYLANVSWLDQLIGELRLELEAHGRSENTLLVYMNDNGWGLGFQFLSQTGRGKGTPYDLGFRTPLIFAWPGHVPSGIVHDDFVSLSDVVPTVYDYVGADPVPDQQGQSLRHRIEGGPPLARSELIGAHAGVGEFVRTAEWRYLHFFSDGHHELYRIDVDPFEQTNVAADHPELIADFAAKVEQWMAQRFAPPERVEITGRLVDRTTGAPLAGCRVRIVGSRLNAIAGNDGSFRLGPVPGDSYQLTRDRHLTALEGLGMADQLQLPARLIAGDLHLPLAGVAHRSPDETYGARIDGTLKDTVGQPLGDQIVKLAGRTTAGRVALYVLTQPDGTYRAEHLPAGIYRVTATAPTGHRRVVVRNVVVDANAIRLDLVSELAA